MAVVSWSGRLLCGSYVRLGKPSARAWWNNQEQAQRKVQHHAPVTDQPQKLHLLNTIYKQAKQVWCGLKPAKTLASFLSKIKDILVGKISAPPPPMLFWGPVTLFKKKKEPHQVWESSRFAWGKGKNEHDVLLVLGKANHWAGTFNSKVSVSKYSRRIVQRYMVKGKHVRNHVAKSARNPLENTYTLTQDPLPI